MLLTDPESVFLWMTALLVHGRRVDAGVGLGDLIWEYLCCHTRRRSRCA